MLLFYYGIVYTQYMYSFFKNKRFLFGVKIAITALIFGILIIHVWKELSYFWTIPFWLLAGYLFGKLTCGTHTKKYGFWLTFLLFVVLNFIHSLFDGFLSLAISTDYRNLAIYSHELIRQPPLYIIVTAMLAPFGKKLLTIPMSVFAVTGVWIIGMYVGVTNAHYLQNVASLSSFVTLTLFIFLGDIIHHLIDEYSELT